MLVRPAQRRLAGRARRPGVGLRPRARRRSRSSCSCPSTPTRPRTSPTGRTTSPCRPTAGSSSPRTARAPSTCSRWTRTANVRPFARNRAQRLRVHRRQLRPRRQDAVRQHPGPGPLLRHHRPVPPASADLGGDPARYCGMTTPTPDRPLRVIQWATGGVGRAAIEGGARPPRPRAGRRAGCTAPARTGVDVGDAASAATRSASPPPRDVDALLAIDADCVLYSPFMADPAVVDRDPRVGQERGHAARLVLPARPTSASASTRSAGRPASRCTAPASTPAASPSGSR